MELNTLVFRGEFPKDKNFIVEPYCGLKASAWMNGDALAKISEMEELFEKIKILLKDGAGGAITDTVWLNPDDNLNITLYDEICSVTDTE